MINIRPHHLFCMHGFQGDGYSDEFTKNMAVIVNSIKENKNIELNVVFNTDDICAKCPSKLGENLCETQEKINKFDLGAINVLDLKEKVYLYKEILQKIKNNLTETKFHEICHDCEWYTTGHCREGLSKLL